MPLHCITLGVLLLAFHIQACSVYARRSEKSATLEPTATPVTLATSTNATSAFFSEDQSPVPPQLSTLVQTLSTYLSDALSTFFTAVSAGSTNETRSKPEQNSSVHLVPHSRQHTSPVLWLLSQFERLKTHFFPPTHERSVLSQTTDLAATAIGDVLDNLVEAHNALLMASIRDRPWYIRVPLYLYRRYSISHKSYIKQIPYVQTESLTKNTLLQQALVQFQTRFKQNDDVQPLASTIVNAFEPFGTKIPVDLGSPASEHAPAHTESGNHLPALPLYIYNHLPSELHRPTVVVLSYMWSMRDSLRRFCYGIWGECWRMHLETMYRRAAPTALECTSLFVRSAAIASAKQILFGVRIVVHVVRVVTNTVAMALDNACYILASETLPVPLPEDNMSYAFFFQLVSLCRMLLLMFVQILRLLWTFTIYKRSFAFLLACTFLYRHSWLFLRFLFRLLRNPNNESPGMLGIRGTGRIWRLRRRDTVVVPIPKPKGKVGHNPSSSRRRVERVSDDSVVLVEDDENLTLHNTDDDYTDAQDVTDDDSIVLSSESDHQNSTPSPPTKRNTGRSLARARLAGGVQRETGNQRNRHKSRAANRTDGIAGLASEDSSVLCVDHINVSEEKENRRLTRSRVRGQTDVDIRRAGQAGKQVNSNPDRGGNKGNDARFDVAMRLLDINRQTAEHAREAMQMVCGDADKGENPDMEEQVRGSGKKQGGVRKGHGTINSGRIVQYAQSSTAQPRKTRRRVYPYSGNE